MRNIWVVLIFIASSAWARPMPESIRDFPRKLSAWKIFNFKDGEFSFEKDVIPFDLNTPLFSDYAKKVRTIYIPEDKKINLIENNLFYPTGTIISKTFYYKPKDFKFSPKGPWGEKSLLIETRILIKTLKKGWLGMAYIWDENLLDATRKVAGKNLTLEFEGKKFTYSVPNANQCIKCHQAFEGTLEEGFKSVIRPIGPRRADNLNRNFVHQGVETNQLSYLKELGLLKRVVDLNIIKKLPVWDDPSTGTIEQRSHAYLEVNCTHCHNLNGEAAPTGFFTDFEIESSYTIKRGFCKSPVAAGRGSGNHSYVVHPKRPVDSILIYRLSSQDPTVRMPELGRELPHKEGIDLLSEYILFLDKDCRNL
jgi:uncharacterized repeat protein (TIGR03806 family)